MSESLAKSDLSKLDRIGLELQQLNEEYEGDDDLSVLIDLYEDDEMVDDNVEMVDELFDRVQRFKANKLAQSEFEEEPEEDNVMTHKTVMPFFSQFQGENKNILAKAVAKNKDLAPVITMGQKALQEIRSMFVAAQDNPDFELDITPYMIKLQPLIDLIEAQTSSERGKCLNCGTYGVLQDELCSPCMVEDRFEQQLDDVTTRLNLVKKADRDGYITVMENWTNAHKRYQRTKSSVDYAALHDLYTKLDAMLPAYHPDPDYDEEDDDDDDDSGSMIGYGSVEVSDNHVEMMSDAEDDELEVDDDDEIDMMPRKRKRSSSIKDNIWQRALKIAATDETKRALIFQHVDDHAWLAKNVPLYETASVFQIFDQKEQKLLHMIFLSESAASRACAKDQSVLEITISK